MAAIAAFLSERERRPTANNFCNNPLDFIHTSNLSFYIDDINPFIFQIIDELRSIRTSWEPVTRTTQKGFQSSVDIFKTPTSKLQILQKIIESELDNYQAKFKSAPCSLIKRWPSRKKLSGWHVILKQHGHQTSHIHPNGWLSGIIYLQVVPSLGKDEGAIEFSLNGPSYSHPDSSKKLYQPSTGDIVLFPSSLHHRTIPFSTDADRICISFDLLHDYKSAGTH